MCKVQSSAYGSGAFSAGLYRKDPNSIESTDTKSRHHCEAGSGFDVRPDVIWCAAEGLRPKSLRSEHTTTSYLRIDLREDNPSPMVFRVCMYVLRRLVVLLIKPVLRSTPTAAQSD